MCEKELKQLFNYCGKAFFVKFFKPLKRQFERTGRLDYDANLFANADFDEDTIRNARLPRILAVFKAGAECEALIRCADKTSIRVDDDTKTNAKKLHGKYCNRCYLFWQRIRRRFFA